MATRTGTWRLAPTWRKSLLVLHLVAGIGWMGLDVGLFLLLFTGLNTTDGALAAACYTAVAVIVPVAVPVLSLGMLATGLLLGWGTTWGLLRYWWVFVKLVLALVLTALVFLSLVPGVSELPALLIADPSAVVVRASLGSAPSQLMFPPVVSFLTLGFASVLAVFKPWGRTSWSGEPRPRASSTSTRTTGAS